MIAKFFKGTLHSYSFRIALLYIALFLISTTILFAFIFVTSTRSVTEQLDETLRADKIAFLGRYQQSDLNGLIRLVNNRVQKLGQEAAYSLITDQQQIVAGNLARWPDIAATTGIMEIELGISPDKRAEYLYRGEVIQLAEGYSLLIARSKRNIARDQNKLINIFIWAALITLLLGLSGGYLFSKRAVRRIASINRLCRNIVDGNISQRLHVAQVHDDLDDLSLNINSMLDKIETLMQEIVQVSDNIAHDMRTPLSHLRLKLESIQAQSPMDETTRNQLHDSIESTDAIIDTFNALLRISKLQAHQRRDQFQLIDPAALLEDVIELYEPLLEDKQQTLETNIPSKQQLKADPDLLFQAISNLLDNAIKYTPEHGTISIALNPQADIIDIIICDDGPGVAEAELSHLSQRFYRVDASRSLPGNGLGLSLVEAIASVHRASLKLMHHRPTGLCARLRFPVD